LTPFEHALRLTCWISLPQDRTTVQRESGRWCFAPGGGSSTSGILISNADTLTVDCFRIDDPRTGEPMNVATVSAIHRTEEFKAALRNS
jgi:hypothetical protein